ncbi:MAG: EAL domain-containing protein [Acidobacteriota bacterium]|nr:EAL domain-containing protein [Acidobacteriota bacterium]
MRLAELQTTSVVVIDQNVSMQTAFKNNQRILIIDDDEHIRGLLLNVLSDNYDCSEAESAEHALIALSESHFDLVISDIQMGGMSGLELVPRVHSIAPDCVVVMVSGRSNIETAIAAMRAGAFDYIMKPFNVRHLEAAVERARKQSVLLQEKRIYKEQIESLLLQRTAEVDRLAYYDTLTDLPNRTLFEDRLAQALAVGQRKNQTLVILFVSLDQWKKVNDSLGHPLADRLLKEVASRLRLCVTESDTVARFGGEEFAILLRTFGQTRDALEIIGAIREVLKPSFDLDGQEIFGTASMGVSFFPLDGEDSQSLLKNAGAALDRAKNAGGDNYQFYTADMNAIASKRLALETSLRQAIDNGELLLHYQPRVVLDSLQISGIEALVRWQHPLLGLVSPADFIPLAEETGLILPIGEWVLRKACGQNKRWQEQGFAPMRVGVNISAIQLQRQDLAETVVRILEETQLAPECLELELTESSIMTNAEATIDILTRLQKMGVTISIDDFGTGFSSLSYLKRLPIDALKIDQSFVRDVSTDQDDAALVMAIITLAHNLRLRVVAEGVETEEQLRFLHLLRCDEIQGFVFSKPLPPNPLERLLLSRQGGRVAQEALRSYSTLN